MLPKILFLDNCYPEKSTFRILEGDLLFKHFPRSKHSKHVYHPDFEREKFDFAYTIGIGPCFERLSTFEKCKIPFIFECYPGFGLNLKDKDKFYKIFQSEFFKGIITTQPCVREHIKQFSVPDSKQCFIYGGFVNTSFYEKAILNKRHKPKIFFCAHPYDPSGKAKGFDIFYEAARKFPDYEFEAFGDWKADPLNNLKIHGEVPNEKFLDVYQLGDLFLSCNRHVSQFDGFPTTAAAEAGMSGCCLLLSDPLNNKNFWKDGEDFIEIEPKNALDKLEYILNDESKRIEISLKGREILYKFYNPDFQFEARKQFFMSVFKDL